VLIAGSAAAFAITERLKLEKTPITKPKFTKVFSPQSEDLAHATADIKFVLRKPDRLTVEVVNGDQVVTTLANDVRLRKGKHEFHWDGRDAAGQPVPAGSYKVRVHLARAHRTIVIPNEIKVDLTRPVIALVGVRPRTISPDHDGRAEFAQIHFRVDEAARALLFVDGHRAGKGRLERRAGKLNWFGKLDGKPLRPGIYTLTLQAEDRAGNISTASRAERVRVRYVALPAKVIHVRAGRRFHVRVETDAERVSWRLAGRERVVEGRVLRLRSPRTRGRYTLFVTANDHSTSATVVVRPHS